MTEVTEVLLRFVFFFTVFALFHSITAHEWFKEKLAAVTSPFFVENFWRLIYCIISFGLLTHTVLDPLKDPKFGTLILNYPTWLYNIMAVTFFLGVLIIYWALIQVDYFEFWGLRQAFRGIKEMITGKKPEKINIAGVDRLEIKGIYHVMRHPMLTGGFLIILSSPPTTTVVIYAIAIFVYMVIGAHYEEKRLRKNIGSDYANYCDAVGAFLPRPSQLIRWMKALKARPE